MLVVQNDNAFSKDALEIRKEKEEVQVFNSETYESLLTPNKSINPHILFSVYQ